MFSKEIIAKAHNILKELESNPIKYCIATDVNLEGNCIAYILYRERNKQSDIILCKAHIVDENNKDSIQQEVENLSKYFKADIIGNYEMDYKKIYRKFL